jgi:predicted O-methyltransferase YrrM
MSERGNDYSAEPKLPPLVGRAAGIARDLGFVNSCAIPYGRLLQVLAANRAGGLIGEMGTGCGVGTAWMATAISPDTQIITIEQNAHQVEAARELFSDHGNVTVLHGDALDLAAHGPFDLLYTDAGPGKRESQDVSVGMMRPGGMIVIDDLTPGEANGLRTWWMNCPDLVSIEITLTADFAAILSVRR